MENHPNRIIWHHSADVEPGHQAEKINRYHRTRKFPLSILGFYGGYHVLVEKDGTIFRYRADNEIGAHDAGENINSLGICMAGNFSIEQPTGPQELTFRSVLLEWMGKYGISADRIDPHRFGDATECPGKLLPDDWARRLVSERTESPVRAALEDIMRYIKSQIDATR